MRVVQLPDATAFLDATHAFRSANVALTNLLGSIATAVVEGRRYADQTWLAIEDEDGVVGCAIRTAPWPLAVSPMPLEGARALGQVLRDLDPDLPGIVGPLTVVHGIADSMGREASIAVAELVRVLGDYVKPGSVPGQARVATTSDLPLAREWWGRFAADIGQPLRDIAGLPDQLEQMFADERLVLWEVRGEPVAMAGHAVLVVTAQGAVGRIGPVFTPEEQRRQGFGAAVTGAVVERLQSRCEVIMLFTDAANRTSNGVYERLGFEPVAEVVEAELRVAHEAS